MLREAIGLVAGVLVMISYFYKGKALRIINILGSILFTIYGVMIGGLSIVLLNGGAIIIHLYYILKGEE